MNPIGPIVFRFHSDLSVQGMSLPWRDFIAVSVSRGVGVWHPAVFQHPNRSNIDQRDSIVVVAPLGRRAGAYPA